MTSGSNADRVLNAIRQAREEMGMSVSQVMQLTSLSENDVRQAIEQVAADGHVYSTVDDDHFKTCKIFVDVFRTKKLKNKKKTKKGD